jgi:mono/diheme cytochrome c family protein
MAGKSKVRLFVYAALALLAAAGGWVFRPCLRLDLCAAAEEPAGPTATLEARFRTHVQPLVKQYCIACHGPAKQKGKLDLSRDESVALVASNMARWERVLERLEADEMPPEDAKRRPKSAERAAVIAWLREFREREARRNAGDPGLVLARRLSNAELDYTIRDLTGIDIRPAREFPVDPANEAGFDNSGESLAMTPALLKKYLAAARLVADHVLLKPDGFVFAPHPVVTETDRDKYCVARIIDFYKRHGVDYADYFLAAWQYRHRVALGRPDISLNRLASDMHVSAKYLAMIWSALTEAGTESGPLGVVQKLWQELPAPERGGSAVSPQVRGECSRLRDVVLRMRGQLKPNAGNLQVSGISRGSQPLVLWRNQQLAAQHRSYSGKILSDWRKLSEQVKNIDGKLAASFTPPNGKGAEGEMQSALQKFCNVFPDAFVVSDRGPYFDPKAADKGRPLTAGFHLMHGHFRDDEPLCQLILGDRERHELNTLWEELNFITLSPLRQYRDFIFFERAEPPRFMIDAQFDFARSEDKDSVSAEKMKRLAGLYLAKAQKKGASREAVKVIAAYFRDMGNSIRHVERAHLAAEPKHLEALTHFAGRAYRRPLTGLERDDLLSFYRQLRNEEKLTHEEALRDTLVTVLMSPHFYYRFNLTAAGPGVQPLSGYELASRLSYFLWSSMPDEELLAHAKTGDLHQPDVLKAQTRRMLGDPRVRGLATEFLGNWLDFRRFEEHNAVDRQRFPSFTNDLRQAMFEEPIRYFVDIVQKDRSVLDLLYGTDTFVNPVLARHYGMPGGTKQAGSSTAEWVHVSAAGPYGRGGLLPMAVFLTKNAPGLRTSPVKRGYWVVRRLLGEQIPPPPPTVPELPKDEANLGGLTLAQVLARHRADKACAGCHRRFDAVGLVFEDFGPVGERRTKDLGGRAVETLATFPDGKDRTGLEGLRAYLREKRQGDFVDNLCKKLFTYALGRSLLLSDRPALDQMKARLHANDYTFGTLVEAIVGSPQFLNKRGRGSAGE